MNRNLRWINCKIVIFPTNRKRVKGSKRDHWRRILAPGIFCGKITHSPRGDGGIFEDVNSLSLHTSHYTASQRWDSAKKGDGSMQSTRVTFKRRFFQRFVPNSRTFPPCAFGFGQMKERWHLNASISPSLIECIKFCSDIIKIIRFEFDNMLKAL